MAVPGNSGRDSSGEGRSTGRDNRSNPGRVYQVPNPSAPARPSQPSAPAGENQRPRNADSPRNVNPRPEPMPPARRMDSQPAPRQDRPAPAPRAEPEKPRPNPHQSDSSDLRSNAFYAPAQRYDLSSYGVARVPQIGSFQEARPSLPASPSALNPNRPGFAGGVPALSIPAPAAASAPWGGGRVSSQTSGVAAGSVGTRHR